MRFQYDGDWVESGVPLGADLPLEHGVLRPRLGKSAFGFLEDRAISAPVFSIFNDPAAPLSGLPEGAGRLETTALLLPHRTDSLGALSVTPVDVDPLPERPRVKRQSELPELIYAYHAMERGKAGSDEVSLLQNGLTLPGRRPVFTVERHREAQTARLRSMLDPIDRPLWMHMALVAAKRCGIRTVETDLEHEMGENILFTRRADRRGANADAPADKPLLTLTGATLAARHESPRPVPPGYLALADILNGGGAAPKEDLPQMWRRIAFQLLTGGAGDSLNRWQFHREPLGWRLSPAHTLEWNPSGPHDGRPQASLLRGRRHSLRPLLRAHRERRQGHPHGDAPHPLGLGGTRRGIRSRPEGHRLHGAALRGKPLSSRGPDAAPGIPQAHLERRK